jgi:hypothetical protein
MGCGRRFLEHCTEKPNALLMNFGLQGCDPKASASELLLWSIWTNRHADGERPLLCIADVADHGLGRLNRAESAPTLVGLGRTGVRAKAAIPLRARRRRSPRRAGSSLIQPGTWFGAPRPMKIGTIRSPRRYEAVARSALRPHNPGCPAIFRYASWTAVFPISQGGPVTLR